MEIIISNSSNVPIYEQIKEQIKNLIMKEELKANDLLPSIRSLAKDLHCSVITTKNAYLELQKEGYVKTIPSKGYYVSNINKSLLKEKQLNEIEQLLDKAILMAKMNNISKTKIKEMLDILYEEDK